MVRLKKYKAILVAKGYTKRRQIIFNTFFPIAQFITICVLLSLATSRGLRIHQIDVKTIFLNGELEEDIYMDQPDWFVPKCQK